MAQLVTTNMTHLLNMLEPTPGQVELLLCLWQDQKEAAGLEVNQAVEPAAEQAAAATSLSRSSLKLAPSPRQTPLPTGEPTYHMVLNMVLSNAEMPSACQSCLCSQSTVATLACEVA